MKKLFPFKNFLKEYAVYIIFTVLPLLIIFHWFSSDSIIYFWDSLFPLNPANNLYHFVYLWKASVFAGNFDPGWSWLPYLSQIFILNTLLQSLSLSQTVLYWTLMFSSLVGFYLLIKELIKELVLAPLFKIGISMLGAILYSYNIYVFYYSFRIFNPQEYIIAFLPLNFLALIRLLPLGNIRGKATAAESYIVNFVVFFISSVLMIPGFSSIVFFLEYLLLVVAYLLVYVLIRPLTKKKFFNAAIVVILLLLIHTWWVFPMILAASSVYSLAAGIGSSIYFSLNSQLSNLANSLRVIGMPPMQNPIFSWENIYKPDSLFATSLFIFPLLILILALQIKRFKPKPLLLFIFTIFLGFLFLVKEANPPLSFIMKFGFDHIPFFGVFRDAYHKAGIYYTFAYFLLVTYSLGFYLSTLKRSLYKLLLIAGTLFTSTVMIAPFFFPDNVPALPIEKKHPDGPKFSAKVHIPDEYFQLKGKLEELCIDTPVLVIPRTSILSSAVWRDYNSNYVGQDILHNITNCDFIVSQTSNNASDAYFSLPYLYLQNQDILGFKKFMERSHTGIVLLRKDYISNEYTDWVPVDVGQTQALLNKDPDFKNVYDSEYFSIYTTTVSNNSYGFSLPSSYISTNIGFTKSSEIRSLLNSVEDNGSLFLESQVIAQSPLELKESDVIFGNCIGCEYFPNNLSSQSVENFGKGRIRMLLGMVKSIFHKKQEPTLDKEIVKMELEFQKWLHAKKENASDEDELLHQYKATVQRIIALLQKSKKDEFEKDYDAIKVRNFLNSEYKLLSQHISDALNNALEVFYFQQQNLDYLNSQIWETDFNNHIIRYRLDISKDDNYVCNPVTISPNIHFDDFYLENGSRSGTLSSQFLKRGSYKVALTYTPEDIINQQYNFGGNKFTVRRIELGTVIPHGYYKLALRNDSEVSSISTVVISTMDIPETNPDKIVDSTYNSIVYKRRLYPNEFKNSYEDYFTAGSDPYKKYFLYIINELNQTEKTTNYSLHVSITPIPTSDSVQFLCQRAGEDSLPPVDFSVERTSPTSYEISFAEDTKNRVLAFNQTFNSYWDAYTIIDGKKHQYHHTEVDGYANGWYIDQIGDKKVFVEFTAQKLAERVALISLSAFVVLAVFFIFYKKRKKKYE